MIISNQQRGRAVILASANETHAISDFAFNAGETVQGVTILEVYFSGLWTVSRGANTLLNLSGTDHWSMKDSGVEISLYPAANVTVSTTTSNSSIILVVEKQSIWANTANSDYYVNN